MDSDDVSNSLNNRAVFKFVGKNHQSASLKRPILLDLGPHVDKCKCAGVSLRILSFVGVRGVNNDSKKVVSGILSILTFGELMILVASFFLRLDLYFP